MLRREYDESREKWKAEGDSSEDEEARECDDADDPGRSRGREPSLMRDVGERESKPHELELEMAQRCESSWRTSLHENGIACWRTRLW